MDFKKEKLVRFDPTGKQYDQSTWEKDVTPLKLPKPLPSHHVPSPLLKPDGNGRISGMPNIGRSKVFPEDHEPWQKRILDPGSELVLRWNRVFLFTCLVALFIDPLYFYLPSVVGLVGQSPCMETDLNLRIVVTCFRTVADLFYLLHMVIKFRTAYVAPSSRVFGRGELVMDPKKIARRYLRSDFFIDLIATLPLPQIVIWFIMPAIRTTHAEHNNNALVLIVLIQYIPRLYLIFPLSSQMIKATGLVTKTAWAGAVYNLLLYMLASHVLGASWYLLSIERQTTCWKTECRKEIASKEGTTCSLDYFDCGSFNQIDRQNWANGTLVFQKCDPNNQDSSFTFGIFENALTKGVVSSKFLEKYLYCLWWGLQNLRYDKTGIFGIFHVFHRKMQCVMLCSFSFMCVV